MPPTQRSECTGEVRPVSFADGLV
jgi:methylthioribose-1-phosphate isomerase